MTPLPRTARARALTTLLFLSTLGSATSRAAEPQSNASTPSAAPAVAPPQAPGATAPASPEDARRVIYLPESAKNELREEIKREVLEQAKREGWAAPGAVPAWLERLRFAGDVRARFERDLFGAANANGGEFPDFNAINQGKPFDLNGVDLSNDRWVNVDQDRTRPRLRARLGVTADLGAGWSAGIRLGSGDSMSPVTNNQTVGNTFSKYPIWLDRAFIAYELGATERVKLQFLVGRFDNPFFATSLIYWDELGVDGLAVKATYKPDPSWEPFVTIGAFPLYTSAFAFAPEQTSKFGSWNKWMYGSQVGTAVRPSDDLAVKLGFAFYYFDNKVQGALSLPCDNNLSYVSCSTDESRPSFAQKGNTYMQIRTPSDAALAAAALGPTPNYQFFGLASRFRELAVTARADYALSPALSVGVEAEYVHNAGFKKGEVTPVALNNRGPVSSDDPLGPYQGGNNGALGRLIIGTPALAKLWDWRFRAGYTYLQSDAVLDALNDPDFGLGGTNLKGYSLDATLALTSAVSTSLRWFSANQVSGPPYAVDVLQIDLLARF